MSSFQPAIDKSTELTPLTSGVVGEAASNLANEAEKLSCDDLSPRLDGASRALSGEDAATSGAVATTKKTPLEIAQEMVDSYAFDTETGVSTFTVPAGVNDVDAMMALNEYFEKNISTEHFRINHSRANIQAVCEGNLDWYKDLPEQHSDYCHERDCSVGRQITITGVVAGTKDENRTTQGGVLEGKSLVFSDPRDQALAGAIHACKHNGEDLFRGNWVRGSVPGLVVGTNNYSGVYLRITLDESDPFNVAASGSLPRI